MRQLAPILPQLTHYFHLLPEHIVKLTPRQLQAYIYALPQQKKG